MDDRLDEVDRAHYRAFALTWAASARTSAVTDTQLEERLVAYFQRL